MTYAQEKTILGLSTLASSAISAIGAIVVGDDVLKYLYVTMTVSAMTAGFMALVFRRQHDSIKPVVGRCGLSWLGGIFGTRVLMHHFHIQGADEDIIYLMGLSGGVTIASFLVGFAFLQLIAERASLIVERIAAKLGFAIPPKKEEK